MRADGYEQLIDGEPITMESNEVFKFKCCDCGLVHDMVVATEEKQEIGFVIERDTSSNLHKVNVLNSIRNEILRELSVYTYEDGDARVVQVKDIGKAISAIIFRDEKKNSG